MAEEPPDELRKLFDVLANAVLELLGEHRPEPVRKVFWRLYHERITALPAHIAAMDYVKAQPGFVADEPEAATENRALIFLSSFILRAIADDYRVDEAAVETMLADARPFLAEGKHSAYLRYYVKGARTPTRHQHDELTLRPIEAPERAELAEFLEMSAGEFGAAILTGDEILVIEQRWTCTSKDAASAFSERKRVADAMVTYLRVHCDSALVFIYALQGLGSLWMKSGTPQLHSLWRVGMGITTLPADVLERWPEERATLLGPPPALAVALRRFEMLVEFANPDRILDQIIILEALFSDDEKQELSHKLSLRIANFLGGDVERRKHLFALMKDGYTARSKLSHGKELPPKLLGIDGRVAEVVREALARYLRHVQSAEIRNARDEQAFIRRLDEMCLGGPAIP